MTTVISTERVFALSAFEGVRLIRSYISKQPATPLNEILVIIEHIEADASGLDLEAAAYLHDLVKEDCVLDGDEFYQACITAVVTQHQPNWCKAMKQGRMRFLNSLDANERDVFAAAGIAKNPAPMSIINWWDEVTGFARLLGDIEKMAQARAAEQLSIGHEIARLAQLGIDRVPEHKGLDDNFAGYDVLSYDIGEVGPVNRMIEVKSTVAAPLRFIVTRNEWDQAEKIGDAYIFHVWDMAKIPPVLFERTAAQIAPHIPKDNEKGKWKTAEIPLGG
jgi:hypothetical protein